MTLTENRKTALRQMLSERRREMYEAVRDRLRRGRADRRLEGRDDREVADADIQDDVEFALLQFRADTLERIDEALARLDAGQYGSCVECGSEIAEQRLRALPFAVRCHECAERLEQDEALAKRLAADGTGFPLFSSDASG